MSLTRIAAASVFAVIVGGFALHMGCSADDEPDCTRDSNCVSANTACTKGVCREGKCVADAVKDGTRVTDQSPVQGKFCVKLECKAGKATEAADNTKTAPIVECQRQSCEGTTPKTEPLLDGVPCRSSMGACQGGVCVPSDSGPIGMADTAPMDSSAEDAAGDTEMADAAAD